jgi:lysophospholipase L1-like esterase
VPATEARGSTTTGATSAPAAAAPSTPVVTKEATKAHQAAQARLRRGRATAHELVHFTPLENARALEPFYRRLRELEDGLDRDGKVRIAFYGASSVAADRYTGYLRTYLQARFGDAGPGFVAIVPLWRWHRHDEVDVEASRSWTIEHALRRRGRLDGRYGLLGASASTAQKGARARVELEHGRSTSFDFHYLAQPGGGTFAVRLDGKLAREIRTDAAAHGPGHARLEQPGGARVVQISTRGDGEVRLFGVAIERDQSGVVLDELGIGGTEAADQLGWDLPIWQDSIRRRAPDLYVLAYGTNAAAQDDEELPLDKYREELPRVLARYRDTLPDAACLIVGPADLWTRNDADERRAGDGDERALEPRLAPILEFQRDLAARAGCAFFDTRAMMGGEGTMPAWVEAKLARKDHVHFTPRGYAHMGRVLADALMAPYDASGAG